jgi:acetyltransferase-like isoleucine patch superfamily enzyme
VLTTTASKLDGEHLRAAWRLLITQTVWRQRMARVGRRAILHRPLLVAGSRFISIGERTSIRQGARLEAILNPNGTWEPKLSIGNNVNIEQGAHIVCSCVVEIGDDVSVAPYCAIVDTYHPHDVPDEGPKIGARLPLEASHVSIGAGTFVGAHSVILPNVTIGRWCVIGAGSVVTKDVPDYTVVAGVPATSVRRYDPLTKVWRSCRQERADDVQ